MTAPEQAEVLALAECLEAEAQDIYRRLGIALTRSQALLAADGLHLLAQQPAPESAESITVDEFIRREGPNWAGVNAQAYVRSLRGGNESALAEENRRLREALEWFADEKVWYGLPDHESGWFSPATLEGRGRARAALSAAEAPAGRDG